MRCFKVYLRNITQRKSDNQPVDGATIWLYGALSTNSTTTDPNGLFSFPSVTPGVYNIVAEAPGLGLAELFGQTIASTQDVTLVLSDVFKRDDFAEKNKDNFLVANNNPFSESLTLQFSTPEQGAVITVQNSLGQMLQSIATSGNSGAVVVGQNLPAGAYFLRLELKGQLLQTIKVLKN